MNTHGYQHHIANHIYHDETGNKQTLDRLLASKDGVTWTDSFSNEFGQLSYGVVTNIPTNKYVKSTNNMFIPKYHVPQAAKVTYTNLICDLRPLKKETHIECE